MSDKGYGINRSELARQLLLDKKSSVLKDTLSGISNRTKAIAGAGVLAVVGLPVFIFHPFSGDKPAKVAPQVDIRSAKAADQIKIFIKEKNLPPEIGLAEIADGATHIIIPCSTKPDKFTFDFDSGAGYKKPTATEIRTTTHEDAAGHKVEVPADKGNFYLWDAANVTAFRELVSVVYCQEPFTTGSNPVAATAPPASKPTPPAKP